MTVAFADLDGSRFSQAAMPAVRAAVGDVLQGLVRPQSDLRAGSFTEDAKHGVDLVATFDRPESVMRDDTNVFPEHENFDGTSLVGVPWAALPRDAVIADYGLGRIITTSQAVQGAMW